MKSKNTSKGLGDTVDKITTKTGIKKVVKKVFGDDCGCEERRQKLNKLFPYKTKECLTEEEYLWCDDYFNTKEKNQAHVVHASKTYTIQLINYTKNMRKVRKTIEVKLREYLKQEKLKNEEQKLQYSKRDSSLL